MDLSRRHLMGGGIALAGAAFPPAIAAGRRPPLLNHIVLEDDRVWIAAKIEDKGPYLFVIDTGGDTSLINNVLAKQIGLADLRGRRLMGIGGVSEYAWYKARAVTLASGIRFPDMVFAGTSARIGKGGVGAFGAGMFTTFDSDLDFVKGEWRVYVDGRPDFAGLTRLDSRFTKTITGSPRILAKATLGGFDGDFLLDTGAVGEAMLTGRAAKASGLWNDARPYAPHRQRGIGKGAVPSRIVRADRLKIGPFVWEAPLVTLNEPGTIRAVQQDGILGLRALGRLHLTTQVSKGVLWAAPNDAPLPPATYALSGLWLDAEGDRVTVTDVGFGSPAAQAGVRRGDRVIGAFAELLRAINGPAGKPVSLTLEQGQQKRTVQYTLAPWL